MANYLQVSISNDTPGMRNRQSLKAFRVSLGFSSGRQDFSSAFWLRSEKDICEDWVEDRRVVAYRARTRLSNLEMRM
jgi:hypothetical protein